MKWLDVTKRDRAQKAQDDVNNMPARGRYDSDEIVQRHDRVGEHDGSDRTFEIARRRIPVRFETGVLDQELDGDADEDDAAEQPKIGKFKGGKDREQADQTEQNRAGRADDERAGAQVLGQAANRKRDDDRIVAAQDEIDQRNFEKRRDPGEIDQRDQIMVWYR